MKQTPGRTTGKSAAGIAELILGAIGHPMPARGATRKNGSIRHSQRIMRFDTTPKPWRENLSRHKWITLDQLPRTHDIIDDLVNVTAQWGGTKRVTAIDGKEQP